MQNLTKEYTVIFNAITDAEKELNDILAKLVIAQQLAEEAYISKNN